MKDICRKYLKGGNVKMLNKRIIVYVLVTLITVGILNLCVSSVFAQYPEKPINVIVAYGAGGGTDVGARILMPYVEEELGVSMVIINKAGGSGWVGWSELIKAEPDGYTIGFINSPSFIPGYLDPQYNREDLGIDSFALIANQVVDLGAIAINPDDERYSNFEELIEYAKNNEVSCAQDGVGSDDWMAMMRFNKNYGTKFVSLATKSTAESIAGVQGGHMDVVFANVGELTVPHDSGKLKVVAVMNDERDQFLPGVPSTKELGYEIYSSSSRGIAGPAGIDEAKVEILVNAFEKAIKNEEHIKKMADMGLQVKFMKGEEFMNHLKADEQTVKDVAWW